MSTANNNTSIVSTTKRRVSYFYQNEVGLFYYGPGLIQYSIPSSLSSSSLSS